MDLLGPTCISCEAPLVEGENWTAGMVRKREYLCRECNRKKASDWYRRNKERGQKTRNDYYHRNREAILAEGRQKRAKVKSEKEDRRRQVAYQQGDTPGYLYALVHPNHPGKIKVGRARDLRKRLTAYQVGCPDRAYSYAFTLAVPDIYRAELQAHYRLDGCRVPGTEWFQVSPEDALGLLTSLTYEETA